MKKIVQFITFNERTLQNFMAHNFTSNNGEWAREITPAEINRVFLCAIVQKRPWTDEFATLLETVLSFVENFSSGDLIAKNVKENTYPSLLTNQMHYLLDLHHKRETIRPDNHIILPHQAETGKEWTAVLYALEKNARETIYASVKSDIEPLLFDYLQHNPAQLNYILFALPTTEHEAFQEKFKEYQEEIRLKDKAPVGFGATFQAQSSRNNSDEHNTDLSTSIINSR